MWWRHPVIRSLGSCYTTAPATANVNPLRSGWVGVVGLEIHAQIASQSKLFCRSPIDPTAPPNMCVGIFDSAHPGTLPVLNRRCVEAALLTAKSLGSRVNPVSYFDRKHYFYPDLPAGYQITQQRAPVAEGGAVQFVVEAPERAYVTTALLERIQIEEDSGKCIHDTDNNRVLVDLNRAGVGLLELVFAPCLSSAEEAEGLVNRLALILQRTGVCTGRMNEGALRVDANVSVHRVGSDQLGVRTEVKNINGVNFLGIAVRSEFERQCRVLEEGGEVINETRKYDPHLRTTFPMRDKETLQDYRFMPEPNLPPLKVSRGRETGNDSYSYDLTTLPPLPPLPRVSADSFRMLIEQHQLLPHYAARIMSDPALEELFLRVVDGGACSGPVTAALLLYCVRLQPALHHWCVQVVREVVQLEQQHQLRPEAARAILTAICNGDPRPPKQLATEERLLLTADVELITSVIRRVLTENPDLVARYRQRFGNPKKRQRPVRRLVMKSMDHLTEDTDIAVVEKAIIDGLDRLMDSDGSH